MYRMKFLYFTNLYKDYYIYSYNIFSLLIYLVLPLMPLQIFENEQLLSFKNLNVSIISGSSLHKSINFSYVALAFCSAAKFSCKFAIGSPLHANTDALKGTPDAACGYISTPCGVCVLSILRKFIINCYFSIYFEYLIYLCYNYIYF